MKRVTGIGGVFFKAEDPEKLYERYEKHLGLKREPYNGAVLHWREADDPQKPGMTVWSLFKKDTKYFDPSRSSFMVNYRVEDLDTLLAALGDEGVEIDAKRGPGRQPDRAVGASEGELGPFGGEKKPPE